MRNRRKFGLFILLIAAGVVWWGLEQYRSAESGPPPLHLVEAGYGEISQRVVAHGTVQPIRQVEVGSQVSGIIDEVLVDFNSRVTQGQVIAQIDPSTFRAEVSSAQAELEAAEASLELARMQWERVRELRENQFVAMSEVDEANANLRQAEAQVRVRSHALERAMRELERCTITSPTDGIVISRSVDVGQTVAASLSAPLLFLIATDLNEMWIHANVSEADIGMVSEGQSVRFHVDAYRDREFSGEVIQVRNSPIIEDNVVHYETIIRTDNRDRLLKPGMTAEVSVITAERQDVLRLRNTALRARLPDTIRPDEPEDLGEEERVVYLFREGRIESAAIKTGLSDGVYTEVLEGLEAGDTLVVGLSLRATDEGGRGGLMTGRQAQY